MINGKIAQNICQPTLIFKGILATKIWKIPIKHNIKYR